MTSIPALDSQSVNERLETWKQGDFTREITEFAVGADLADIEAPEDYAGMPFAIVFDPVAGVVILSQTCDLLRDAEKRPFVEICPLVQLDENTLEEVKLGRRPQFAYVPGAAQHGLAADLDRVATVSKRVIACAKRECGCVTDQDKQTFAKAIARKRKRFAFPDDFSRALDPLRQRVTSKHNKNSDEGAALRAVQSIRVGADPCWSAQEYEVTFYFILRDDADDEERNLVRNEAEGWLSKIKPPDGITIGGHLVVSLEDLTAKDYLSAVRLDLEHVSMRPV